MKQIKFLKIHGNGNDFVLIEDLKNNYQFNKETIQFLCDRKKGVGADGLLLIKPPKPNTDFTMQYYNADGGRVDFCGNGGRCISYASSQILGKYKLSFYADDGLHQAEIFPKDKKVSLIMTPAKNISIPNMSSLLKKLNIEYIDYTAFNTGVPHLVIELKMENSNTYLKENIFDWGKSIRYSDFFAQDGININFTIQDKESGKYFQRTYERGVEDETLSCGTGSVAVALYWQKKNSVNQFPVITPGGTNYVDISFHQEPILSGIVSPVFEGEISLNK